MNDFLILIIGIKVGVLLGWTISFFIRKKKKRIALIELQAIQNERDTAKINFGVISEKTQIMEQQINSHKTELEEKNNQLLQNTAKLSTSEANMQNMLQKIEEQKKELESVRHQMNIEFRNLANDILEEKTKKFTEQNREKLDELLKPLGEKLKDFEKKVE